MCSIQSLSSFIFPRHCITCNRVMSFDAGDWVGVTPGAWHEAAFSPVEPPFSKRNSCFEGCKIMADLLSYDFSMNRFQNRLATFKDWPFTEDTRSTCTARKVNGCFSCDQTVDRYDTCILDPFCLVNHSKLATHSRKT